MKLLRSLVLFALPLSLGAHAQTAASDLLRPGLSALSDGLGTLRLDKWKLPAAARAEVEANVGSMHRDLETTLPPLLAAADSAPATVSAQLPVSRNLTALYDVLLRVAERGKASAPTDQAQALEQTRAALDAARRAFDENLQTAALAQEATLRRLQSAPPPPSPPVATPPPPPPAKKKPRSKPAASN